MELDLEALGPWLPQGGSLGQGRVSARSNVPPMCSSRPRTTTPQHATGGRTKITPPFSLQWRNGHDGQRGVWGMWGDPHWVRALGFVRYWSYPTHEHVGP